LQNSKIDNQLINYFKTDVENRILDTLEKHYILFHKKKNNHIIFSIDRTAQLKLYVKKLYNFFLIKKFQSFKKDIFTLCFMFTAND
jgi:hypothetical protein